MYPDRQLTLLAARKDELRRSIALGRAECAAAAVQVVRPLELLDRMLALWRRFSPLVKITAVPLGWLLKRSPAPRTRVLGTLLRWGPLVLGAVRRLASRRPRARG